MKFVKSVLLVAALLAAAAFAANAQLPYPPYPYPYSYPAPPAAPPAWSYDPYTSGLGPCPQRRGGEPQCRYTVEPTYGQPNYWPAH
jgi:hypothetical protein